MISLFENYENLIELTQGSARGDQAIAFCPCHDDSNPSLSISLTDDKILFYCHSGCSQSELMRFCRNNNIQIGGFNAL